jgi:hypothetical protein
MMLGLWLIWGRSKTLSLVLHDAAEETTLAVTERGGRGSWTTWLRSTTNMGLRDVMDSSGLELVPQHANFSLIFLLHLELILLQLIHFVANQLHFLNLLWHLALNLLGRATLIVEFDSQRIQDLVEPMVGLAGGGRPQVGVAAMLSSIKHGERGCEQMSWNKIRGGKEDGEQHSRKEPEPELEDEEARTGTARIPPWAFEGKAKRRLW